MFEISVACFDFFQKTAFQRRFQLFKKKHHDEGPDCPQLLESLTGISIISFNNKPMSQIWLQISWKFQPKIYGLIMHFTFSKA